MEFSLRLLGSTLSAEMPSAGRKVINKVAYFPTSAQSKHTGKAPPPPAFVLASLIPLLFISTASPSSIRRRPEICGCRRDGLGQRPSNFERLPPVDVVPQVAVCLSVSGMFSPQYVISSIQYNLVVFRPCCD